MFFFKEINALEFRFQNYYQITKTPINSTVYSIVLTEPLGSCIVALVTKTGFQNRSLSLCLTIMQSITSTRSLEIQPESVFLLYKLQQFNISSSPSRIFVPYRWFYILMPRDRTLASFIMSLIHQQNAHIQ
jgi:hypothetical protein